MSLYAQFQTNTNKELNGVNVEFAPNADKTVPSFLISRQGKSNKAFAKAIEAATRPYRRQIELKTMDPEKAEDIFMDVFIATVLKDWSNVHDKSGSPLPFHPQTARKLFIELPDLYDDLQTASKDAALFRDEELESEAKN